MKNKKGSYTVFIALIFMSMIILLVAAIRASVFVAVSGATEAFGRLWGKSVLAEYDTYLQSRYGIYAFCGNDYYTGKKLDYYADFSFADKRYVKCDEAVCELEDYRITNPEIFKDQVLTALSDGVRPKPYGRTGDENSSRDSGITNVNATTSKNRYIDAEWITDYLPSKGKNSYLNVRGLISKAENVSSGISLSGLTDNIMVDSYIFRFFRYREEPDGFTDTYFQNEIEYILSGKLNDEKAAKEVRTKLVLLRTGLNSAYLWSSEEKRAAAMAAGELLFPELGPLIAQAIIIESWAALEAENDLAILYDGKEVPVVKGDRNFALSIESVLFAESGSSDEIFETGTSSEKTDYVKPQVIEGQNYGEYLSMLLKALSEDTKLLRMMDLMEINGKYNYCDYFSLREYYTGLKYTFRVNGRTHEFEEAYKKKEGELLR